MRKWSNGEHSGSPCRRKLSWEQQLKPALQKICLIIVVYFIINVCSSEVLARIPSLNDAQRAEYKTSVTVVGLFFVTCCFALRKHCSALVAISIFSFTIAVFHFELFSNTRYTVGLERVMGDTLGYVAINSIPNLSADAKYYASCQVDVSPIIDDRLLCRVQRDAASELGPDLGWVNKDLGIPLPLTPFKVSTARRTSSLLLSQMRQTNSILKACGLRHVESISIGSASNHVTLQSNSQGVGTMIVFEHSSSGNIYHAIHMDPVLMCYFLGSRDALSHPVYGVSRGVQWKHHTGAALLSAMLEGRVVSAEHNRTFLRNHAFRSIVTVRAPLGFPFPFWDSFKLEPYRVASPFGTQFSAFIRRSFFGNAAIPKTDVVVLQRGRSRRMVGSKTGSFVEVVDALCKLGLRAIPIEISESLPIKNLMKVLSSAAVFIGVHGAGLSHISWLAPETVVIEVTLRRNFNQSGSHSMYFKSDYANLARFYGLDYNYFDPLHLIPAGSNLDARTIVVDANKLANIAYCAYKRFVTNIKDPI